MNIRPLIAGLGAGWEAGIPLRESFFHVRTPIGGEMGGALLGSGFPAQYMWKTGYLPIDHCRVQIRLGGDVSGTLRDSFQML